MYTYIYQLRSQFLCLYPSTYMDKKHVWLISYVCLLYSCNQMSVIAYLLPWRADLSKLFQCVSLPSPSDLVSETSLCPVAWESWHQTPSCCRVGKRLLHQPKSTSSGLFRFGVVSVLFQCVSVLFQCCFSVVSVLFQCCFGVVSVLFQCCFSVISVLFRIVMSCFAGVSRIINHNPKHHFAFIETHGCRLVAWPVAWPI